MKYYHKLWVERTQRMAKKRPLERKIILIAELSFESTEYLYK